MNQSPMSKLNWRCRWSGHRWEMTGDPAGERENGELFGPIRHRCLRCGREELF